MILEDISNWLSHPFVLLIVGAAITAAFGRYITGRWEDRKRVLQIKINLVEKMSDVLAIAISRSLLSAQRENSTHPDDWDESYNDFLKQVVIRALSIKVNLKSYSKDIEPKWNTLFETLTSYFWISYRFQLDKEDAPPEIFEHFSKLAQQIQQNITFLGSDQKYNIEKTIQEKDFFAWKEVGDELLEIGDDIIQMTLDAKIAI